MIDQASPDFEQLAFDVGAVFTPGAPINDQDLFAGRTAQILRLYNTINRRIRAIHPNFNVGITTGTRGNVANRWNDPHRHWNFQTSRRWRSKGEEAP